MLKKRLSSIAIAATMGLAVTPALSAPTQGTLGSTSTGDVQLYLFLASSIQISSLNDLDFDFVTAGADKSVAESFCVYSNSDVGTYKITTSSQNGTDGGYAMKHTTKADTLAYSLTMDDGSGKKTLTSGTQSTDSFPANSASTNCGGSTNATVEATVTSANLAAVAAGEYTDTLVLVVSPD